MKRDSSLVGLGLVFGLWLTFVLGCVGTGGGAASYRRTGSSADEDTARATTQTSLAGTSWLEMSITRKGEAEEQGSSIRPRYQFCRDRSFEIYGYNAQGGTYQLQGDRLVMRYDGGGLYGDFQVSRDGDDLLLDNGEYVIRLRYNGAGCDDR